MTEYGAGRYGLGVYGTGEVVLDLPSAFPGLGDWGGKKPESSTDNAVFIQLAERLAWSTMLRLSAYSVVVEPVLIRPMCEQCAFNTWANSGTVFALGASLPWNAMMLRGFGWSGSCGGGHRSIPLPRPVGRIVDVYVDGAAITPSAYRVDNGNLLTRTDGGEWPTQQSATADVGATGTFEIRYYPGFRPDSLFFWATGQLAFEFFLAMAPKAAGSPFKAAQCRLPAGVTSVVRQGVSYEIDAMPFSKGRTGIIEIDAVLSRYNPNGLSARPAILSPDTIHSRPRLIGR